jgi:hypothetical protein
MFTELPYAEVSTSAIAEETGVRRGLLHIINRTRDLTVEHMLAVLRVESPTGTLRAVLRTYSGLADAATRQWLQEGTLDRGQVHTLLARSLLVLLTDIAPAVEDARARA